MSKPNLHYIFNLSSYPAGTNTTASVLTNIYLFQNLFVPPLQGNKAFSSNLNEKALAVKLHVLGK